MMNKGYILTVCKIRKKYDVAKSFSKLKHPRHF